MIHLITRAAAVAVYAAVGAAAIDIHPVLRRENCFILGIMHGCHRLLFMYALFFVRQYFKISFCVILLFPHWLSL